MQAMSTLPTCSNQFRCIAEEQTLLTFNRRGTDKIVDESTYVRKAEVNAERKEIRLQGLQDQLTHSDEPKAEQLREEVMDLEQHIEELTEFAPGTEVGTRP